MDQKETFTEIKLQWLREKYLFHKKELRFLSGLNREHLTEEGLKDLEDILEAIKEEMRFVVLEGNKIKNKP